MNLEASSLLSAGNANGSWKRDNDGGYTPEAKKKCVSRQGKYHYKLEPESDNPTDTSDETNYSFQLRETDIAKSTSDTSDTSSDYSLPTPTMREYGVASSSENFNSYHGSSSSYIYTKPIIVKRVLTVTIESEPDPCADSSNSSSSDTVFDPELSRKAYRTCQICGCKKNDPHFRFCEKCFRFRKELFPPRPRWKKADKRKRKLQKAAEAATAAATAGATAATHDTGNEYSLQQPSTSTLSIDSGFGASQRSESPEPAAPQPSSDTELCIICMVKPRTCVFVHKETVHHCCCYTCGVKTWMENKKCPYCHQKCSNVLKYLPC